MVSDDAEYVVKIEPHSNGPLFVEMHVFMAVSCDWSTQGHVTTMITSDWSGGQGAAAGPVEPQAPRQTRGVGRHTQVLTPIRLVKIDVCRNHDKLYPHFEAVSLCSDIL